MKVAMRDLNTSLILRARSLLSAMAVAARSLLCSSKGGGGVIGSIVFIFTYCGCVEKINIHYITYTLQNKCLLNFYNLT